jgi:hypothetical protein
VILDGWLEQPLLKLAALALAVIGSLFWIEAGLQGEAFSAEVFGRFATSYPAEMWAAFMMAGGVLLFVGLLRPPRREMVTVGSALLGVLWEAWHLMIGGRGKDSRNDLFFYAFGLAYAGPLWWPILGLALVAAHVWWRGR